MTDIKDFLDGGWDALHNAPQISAEQQFEQASVRFNEAKMITAALTSASGKRLLSWLRSKTVDQPSFVPGPHGADQGFFREGQNSIYREILRMMEISKHPPEKTDG